MKILPFEGVFLTINQSTAESEALKFLEQKWNWVQKQQRRFERDFLPPVNFSRSKDATYPWLGEWTSIPLPLERYSYREAHQLLCDHYRSGAYEQLLPRAQEWQKRTGLHFKKIQFRFNQSRWGSCSSRGSVNLNVKLMCLPLELSDYVIVHELCHLKHMNHSRHFWQLVESFLPDYPRLEKELSRHQFVGNFLVKFSEPEDEAGPHPMVLI